MVGRAELIHALDDTYKIANLPSLELANTVMLTRLVNEALGPSMLPDAVQALLWGLLNAIIALTPTPDD